MWARKRIDISYRELVRAIGSCLWPESKGASIERIGQTFEASDLLVTLSVRSGFDLLLKSAQRLYGWPVGSEVIFSGLTIADMPRIAVDHGLSVVGTDLNPATMSPSAEEVASKITPKTKAIVVAHLMGDRCDLAEISKLARKHDLLLIEDCAQSFTGQPKDFSPFADVSMFSFGSIKTNTALGGAVLKIKDPELRFAMEANHKLWPVRSRLTYLKRVLKYLFVVKPITAWFPASLVKRTFQLAGKNHDAMAAGMARGFAGSDFFKLIRQQPSAALMTVLAKRLRQFDPQFVRDRAKRGMILLNSISDLNDELLVLGMLGQSPTHWVFAIATENPKELAQVLWQAGFDATTYSSLRPVDPNNRNLKELLSQIVFLPMDFPMPERELIRMGKLVAKTAKPSFSKDPATKLAIQNLIQVRQSPVNV